MNTFNKKPRIAFQGERGAFSEEAALKLLGDEIELVPRKTFEQLFQSLDNGRPIIFSRPSKTVSPAWCNRRSNYCARVRSLSSTKSRSRSNNTSSAVPGATFDTIETVQSHPVALAQCRRFFATHPQTQITSSQTTPPAASPK